MIAKKTIPPTTMIPLNPSNLVANNPKITEKAATTNPTITNLYFSKKLTLWIAIKDN